MKALPLAYNKDMQEDKEQVFDAVDTVKKGSAGLHGHAGHMTVNPGNMRRAASEGFINATTAPIILSARASRSVTPTQ
jgi:argininosuccinate lyase